jgi:Uma2 family endonuclease
MSEARLRRWTLEEFLTWEEQQPAKYELVDGQPRPMMGVSQAHALIVANIVTALRSKLRGLGCRPGTSDLRVITGNGNSQYPDALVDCGRFEPRSHNATEPVVLFEVLSRRAAWKDHHDKLHDYDATPVIQAYVVVAQIEARVELWRRDASGRLTRDAQRETLDGSMDLHPVQATLTLAEIYEGLGFEQPGESQ